MICLLGLWHGLPARVWTLVVEECDLTGLGGSTQTQICTGFQPVCGTGVSPVFSACVFTGGTPVPQMIKVSAFLLSRLINARQRFMAEAATAY